MKNRPYKQSLVRAQFLAGQHAEALVVLRELTASNDKPAPAWVHTMMGDCHMALNQPYKARDAYYVARRMKGDDADSWTNIAKAALALHDEPRAVLSAREALRVDATHLDASLILGYALLRQGLTIEAVEAISGAIALHPDSVTLRCLLGRAHAAAGDERSAQRCYRTAVRLDPDNELARALVAQRGGK